MSNRQAVTDWIAEHNPDALLADGFEDALLGICEMFGCGPVAAYDRDRCIEILMERDGMSREDAVECFEFNTMGAWVGEGTPVFVTLFL